MFKNNRERGSRLLPNALSWAFVDFPLIVSEGNIGFHDWEELRSQDSIHWTPVIGTGKGLY